MNLTRTFAGIFCLTLALASPAWAQNAKSQLYGRGVHQYFSGDFAGAITSLTQSIDGGTVDPRVYYYRGLALAATGKPAEARADFQAGAAHEAADSTRYYLVSKALERIQGATRIELETFRVDGRKKLMAKKQEENDARYGRIRASEPEVLRVAPKAGRLQPGADPFADEPGDSEPGKAKPPVKAEVEDAAPAPKKPAKEEKPAEEEKKEEKKEEEKKEEKKDE